VTPPGYVFPKIALIGDAKYGPATASSSGGWQVVDRPKLVAATQWFDRSPMSLTMTCMFDSEVMFGSPGQSIEFYCQAMEAMLDKIPGTNQPAVFAITGPVPGTQRQYVVFGLEFMEAARDPIAGFRTRQNFTLTLYEYNSALFTLSTGSTPAASAQAALNSGSASQSFTLYEVIAGDTLATIAANLLSNYMRWVDIGNLNNIRDPNNVVPGQQIKIPQN